MFTTRAPGTWDGGFIDTIDGTPPPGEHRIRVKWAPHVPPIDWRTFPGSVPGFDRFPPTDDSAYQEYIRGAESRLVELHAWEATNFPRPERTPHRLAYAAPGDDFGPDVEVTSDCWLDLVSADGRTLRACIDLSDATCDGVVALYVHASSEAQSAVS